MTRKNAKYVTSHDRRSKAVVTNLKMLASLHGLEPLAGHSWREGMIHSWEKKLCELLIYDDGLDEVSGSTWDSYMEATRILVARYIDMVKNKGD